jgi:hypothetical protein
MTRSSAGSGSNPSDATRGGLLPAVLATILGLLVAWQVLVFVVHSWMCIKFPYQLDYGEGAIFQIALRIIRGEEMYPSVTGYPYVIASYMPLYYLLSALGTSMTGPSFLFGRLVSCAAALVVAFCAAAIVWQQAKSRFALFLAGGLILATPAFLVWASLMRVDMTALALSVAGFCLFHRGRRGAAIALFALAVLTRRTAVAAMAAAFIDFAWRRGWREAAKLFLLQLLLIAVLVGAAVVLTKGGLFRQLLWHTAGSLGAAWTWAQLWSVLRDTLRAWPVYFVLSFLGAAWCLARPPHRPLLLYFLTACAVFFTAGRIGSSHNYVLEPLVVGMIMTGVLWVELTRRAGLARTGVLLLFGAIALQLLWVDFHRRYVISLHRPRISAHAARRVMDEIAAAPGPVLCEDVGLIELAGKQVVLEPFEFTQMARAGVVDPGPVVADVERGRFSIIVLRFNPEEQPHRPGADWAAGRWLDTLIAALVRRYELVEEVAPYYLYRPRALSPPPND